MASGDVCLYFSISQTPVEPKCCERYSPSARRKPKRSVMPHRTRSLVTLFLLTNQRLCSKWERGGASMTAKAETKQSPKKGLTTSVTRLHFVSGFSSFPSLISSWFKIEWLFHPFWSSSSQDDDFSLFFESLGGSIIPSFGVIQKFMNDHWLVANPFASIIYWWLHRLCTK